MPRNQTLGKWAKKPPHLVKAKCPVNRGHETTMLLSMFSKMCAGHQVDPDSSCRFICGGAWPISGLTLLDDVKEFEPMESKMAGKPSSGTCDLCGAGGKNLRSVKGKNCCSMCEFTWRWAHNNPNLMIEAIKEAHGETYFTDKFGGQSVQKCDCGTVREDLINAERRLHAAGEVIENTRIILGGGSKDESILEIAKRAMSCDGCDERLELQKIRSLCGIDESLPLFEKVESVVGSLNDYREKMSEIRMKIGLTSIIGDVVGRIMEIIEEKDQLLSFVNRMAYILEIDDGEDMEEKARGLVSELKNLREKERDLYVLEATGREAVLLDLALDVMAGKISGIDADRINALR